ncbi:MAG: hypothetical protein Q4G16_11965 [Cruoricaptor ignavus]|nr:hypothetical protein [Cruoricaptor ignavus]
MIRKILAVPAGIIVGSIFILLVQNLGHSLYPQPIGMDANDMNQLAEYVKNAPFMALFFVILSYAAGAISSGFISTKIAGNDRKIYAEICGVIFLIQSIFMMSSLPTPLWFWFLGIASWFLVFIGWKLAIKRK